MNIVYIKTAFILFFSILLFSACEEKLPTEFGNSNVSFGTTSYKLVFQGVSTANLEKIQAETDTIYNVCAAYRSGIVDNLEEITVTLAIDSAYLDSIILAAQTALPTDFTTLMTTYKNSKALGAHYFSIPEKVVIPKGKRSIVVPFTLNRSKLKLYNNAKFNYDPLAYTVTSDKFMVLPIKITSVSSQTILLEKSNYYFQVQKTGDLR